MLGSETWIVLGAGAISAAVAAVIAWLIRKREFEPEDVTIGFLGPSLAAMYLDTRRPYFWVPILGILRHALFTAGPSGQSSYTG